MTAAPPGAEATEEDADVPPRLLLIAPLLALAQCAETSTTWYEARCIDQYGMKRGTAEFEACIAWDRRQVEETQAQADRQRGSGP